MFVLSLAAVLDAIEAFLAVFRWLATHAIDLLVAVGIMSALGKALEVAVRKSLEKHPTSHILMALAKALDFHEGILGVFIKALDIVSFTREDILKKHAKSDSNLP